MALMPLYVGGYKYVRLYQSSINATMRNASHVWRSVIYRTANVHGDLCCVALAHTSGG